MVKQWGRQSKALLISILIQAIYSPLSSAHLKCSIIFKSVDWQLYPLRKADSKAVRSEDFCTKWQPFCRQISTQRCHLTRSGIPIIKIRQSPHYFTSVMEPIYLERWSLHIYEQQLKRNVRFKPLLHQMWSNHTRDSLNTEWMDDTCSKLSLDDQDWGYCMPWACFLSLAQSSKLRLCSANHRAGYFSNLACDWLSKVWAYSEQETENGPGPCFNTKSIFWEWGFPL